MKPTTINGKTITPLIEWGRLIGVGEPLAATAAELTARIQVEIVGASLPAASQLVHVPSGVTFITAEGYILSGDFMDIRVIAVSDQSGGGGLGTVGNLTAGSVLSFANPLGGVGRTATVINQVVTGADAETSDQYRIRVVTRFQLRPQGGAYVDYKLWAESAAGIKQAFPYTADEPGQVDVYIESSTETDGIPTTAQLEAALASINYDNSTGMATRRPVSAFVNVFPIARIGFTVEVIGLSVQNEPAVREEISSALSVYFQDKEPFLVGLTIPPRRDRITVAAVSGVVDDVVSLANGVFTDVNLFIGAVNTPTYTLGKGEKAKLSGVNYT